jgi:hypothetical protein
MKIRPMGAVIFSKRMDIVPRPDEANSRFFFFNFANAPKKAMLVAVTCSWTHHKRTHKHQLQ